MPTSARDPAEPVTSAATALEVVSLSAGYGRVPVLHGLDLVVGSDEFVAVLGPNGAGKSTLLRAIVGAATVTAGAVHLEGRDVTGSSTHLMARRGVAIVPEGRQLVPELSVDDNLLLGTLGWNRRRSSAAVTDAFDAIFTQFPILRDRHRQLAGSLSGGQQQLLAIARALMARPRLLLLDEPSLGLAPKMIHEVFDHLARAHAAGVPILLAEQNSAAALRVVGRAYILIGGRIQQSATADEMKDPAEIRSAIFGVTGDDERRRQQDPETGPA